MGDIYRVKSDKFLTLWVTYCILYTEVSKIFDEKFKIRVSDFLKESLDLDAKSFGFVKENGEANFNLFLNKLIPNLLELKKERRAKILNYAINAFEIEGNDYSRAEDIINGLNSIYDEIYFTDAELDKLNQVVWIRPTKETIAVFDEIMESETEITGLDTSSYIRNMLNEFSRFPRYKKEQITFSKECELTCLARESGRVLKFRYDGELKRAYVFACVYDYLAIQGNYILCYDIERKIICRYQISEIYALHLLDKKYKPSEALQYMCKKYENDALWVDDTIIECEEE